MREHFSASTLAGLRDYMHENGAAVSFFHLVDMLSADFQEMGLFRSGIKNQQGDFILPSAKAFHTESYPFLEPVYIALNRDPLAMDTMRPFFEFALSDEGTDILLDMWYWPISEGEKLAIYTRLGSELGLDIEEIQEDCGPLEGDLEIGGSDTVLPVVDLWSDIYNLGCPMKIDIEGGGSSNGAFRVCSTSEYGDAVDVGMMSRDFDPDDEAVPRKANKFVYDCIMDEGDEDRSIVQLDVALDGISIIFPIGGMGEKCVRLLGGLTLDQLRWMYSSYSDSELEKSGWNPASLSSNDYDSATHKWSELDYRCAESIADGSYPLTRSVFANIHNDEAALREAVPLIRFGYSQPDMILSSGYAPILGDHMAEMLRRLDNAPYAMHGDLVEADTTSSNTAGIIVGSIAAAICFVLLVIVGFFAYRKWLYYE